MNTKELNQLNKKIYLLYLSVTFLGILFLATIFMGIYNNNLNYINRFFQSIKGQDPDSGLLIFSLSGQCPPSMRPVDDILNNRFIMISKDDPSTTTSVNKPDQPTGCPSNTQLGCEKTISNLYIGGSNKIHKTQTPVNRHKHIGGWGDDQIHRIPSIGFFGQSLPIPGTETNRTLNNSDNHGDQKYGILTSYNDEYEDENALTTLKGANDTTIQPHYPEYVRLRACVWGQ